MPLGEAPLFVSCRISAPASAVLMEELVVDNIVHLDFKRKSAARSSSANSVVVRDEEIAQVRRIELKIQTAEGEACVLAMDVGDILNKVKKTISHGRWLPFLKACALATRTAQVYAQLADARPIIEAANAQRAAPLSIRETLKLICPKKPKTEEVGVEVEPDPVRSTISVADVLAWLPTATPNEKRRVAKWLAQDVADMRKILPTKALPPRATDKQVFERAMGLLTVDDAPVTTH